MPGRILPTPRVRGPGLHPSPRPGHEVLQRRGDPLEGAVHRHHHPPSLRQGGLPPYRGRARSRRRSDPARQSLYPGGRRCSRCRPEREVRAQARLLPRDGQVVRRPQTAAARPQGPASHRRRRSQRGAAGTRRVEPQAAAQDRVAHARRGRSVRPDAGVARLDRRAAPLRGRRQEALFMVELPQQRPTSSPRRRCRGRSAATASTPTSAIGRRRRITCRCWRHSRFRENEPCQLSESC